MKKALVILILLAFVGGGLFAQTIQWNGNVHAGLGIRSVAGLDDLYMGMVSPAIPGPGPRLRLQFRWTNEAGNAGVDTMFQAAGTHTEFAGTGTNIGLNVPYMLGWITFNDGMVIVQAGRSWGAQTPLAGADYMNGSDVSGYGIFTTLYPADMFRLGFGLFTAASDTGYTSIADNKAWVDNPFTATLAARLAMANLLTAVANLRLSYDTELEANAISSTITFYTPALPFIDIYGEFILSRLDSFSERGNFQGRLDLIVPYGSVQDDVTIGIHAEYMTSMLEANVDPVITATAWFNYRGITNVLPRLEVGYARGATFSGTATAFGNWGVLFRRSSTYNADNSFLHIKPSVQLRVAANQQVELGGYIAADMSSGNANTSVGGAAEKGTTFGAYVGYQLNF